MRGGIVLTVVAATCALAPAAEAKRGSLIVSGSTLSAARLCDGVHPTAAAGRRAKLRVSAAHPRALKVFRCRGGRWVKVRRVRVRGRRTVRLPRLEPGAYRVTARGTAPAYLRVTARRSPRSYPLLDRAKVRAPMVAYCDGPNGRGPHRPDDARLPVDPRKLINAHLNDKTRGAFFNAAWMPVRDAPGFRKAPAQYPTTCGQFRTAAKEGEAFLYSRNMFQTLGTTKAYDNLWKVWGLSERSKDYDQEVRDRYGFNVSPYRNPYPKAGEDPAKTDGGTGQLPLGLVQSIDESTGEYDGSLTISCASCHDSILGNAKDGLGLYPGRGSDSFDAMLFESELTQADSGDGGPNPLFAQSAGAIPYPFAAGRGINDAFGLIDFLGGLFDMETLDASPGLEVFPNHGAAGQVQTPNWWNRSHRTRMFLGGELSGDNTRVSMALAVANLGRTGQQNRDLEPQFEKVHVFLDSLSPPRFPKKVDRSLAKEGAIIFHEKDLWADSRNRAIPRPMGNGSCSACHGVYSPRYAHDPVYLADPRLKGIEANITRIETIQTDPARTNLAAPQWPRAWNTSWWGYDDLNPKWTREGQGRAGTTFERAINDWSPTNTRLEGTNKWDISIKGYEAPPLYGAWASAPYFHNGSVPTVRGVLRPAERPKLWRRPPSAKAESGIVQGYDTSFKGYDFKNLGYRHSKVACDGGGEPVIPCQPNASPQSVVTGTLSEQFGPSFWLFNQSPPPVSEDDRQRRMVYNTNEYSLGNEGHDFTKVLDDHEVKAILEYLKTL
jgi:mono/diheme cytochrome c family protein